MGRGRFVGVALVVVSAAGFGTGTILARPIYDTGVDWLTLLQWRFLLGAVLAWAWVLASRRRRSAAARLGRRRVLVGLALGAWYSGNAGTYYAGLETVPAALAGVLVYTYPVIVAVLSLRFATRLSGRRTWLALGLAVVGVVLALGGIDVSGAVAPAGLVLVMLSPVIYAGWIILSARLSGERRDRLGAEAVDSGAASEAAGEVAATSALMMTATAGVFAAMGVAVGRPPDPLAVPADAWPGVLAIAFVASFLAIQTFYAGAHRLGAAQAALVSTIEPVIIVVLAAVVLDQRLAPVQLVGAGLILVGVVIAQVAPRPRGAPEPATPLEAEVG